MRPHKRFSHPRFREHRGGRFLFFRFFFVFGFMAIFIFGGIGAFGYMLRLMMTGMHMRINDNLFWITVIAIGLPFLGMLIGGWARRRISNPLSNIMEASEAVSQGDFSVRVPEGQPGEFGQLEAAFNRMVSELEQTDQMRRSLAADVAHELNTPLHIIQGYLEGILDDVYQPDQETINTMLEETRLMARLVEDLRTLSLAEAGVLPLEMRPVDLAELLEDIRTTFSGQTEAAGVEMHIEVDEELTLTADPDRLNQVLINLTANALRYTPQGGQITITAKQNADRIHIEVTDTGQGIDPQHLPHIFERFWRADKSRTHADGSGHGLGLPIARQLVRAHGGEITVESEIGVGTRFSVFLPITAKI